MMKATYDREHKTLYTGNAPCSLCGHTENAHYLDFQHPGECTSSSPDPCPCMEFKDRRYRPTRRHVERRRGVSRRNEKMGDV